jgi:hypothetical protein
MSSHSLATELLGKVEPSIHSVVPALWAFFLSDAIRLTLSAGGVVASLLTLVTFLITGDPTPTPTPPLPF